MKRLFYLLGYIFILFAISNAQSQPKTQKELTEKFTNILKSGKSDDLKEIQAPVSIYRKVAPSQSKGKSDDEFMSIVNTPGFSIFSKLDKIISDFKESGLDFSKLKVKGGKEKKYDMIKVDWTVLQVFYEYDGVPDTLVLEVGSVNNKWYLIDISNEDRELSNIISKKGTMTAHAYYALAIQAIDKQEYFEATNLLDKAIKLNPNYTDAYYELAYVKNETGNYSDAIEPLKKIIEIDNTFAQAYNELGYSYLKLEQFQDAIPIYSKYLEFKPKLYSANYNLAYCLYKVKEYDESKKYFSIAIENNEKNSQYPYYYRGLCNYKLKKYSDAKPDFQKTVEIDETNEDAMYYLGWIANEMGEFSQAVEIFSKAIVLKEDIDTYYELGVAFEMLEKYKEAVNVLIKAKELLNSDIVQGINSSKLFKKLADCYYKLDDKVNACLYYKKSADVGNEDAKDLLMERCK